MTRKKKSSPDWPAVAAAFAKLIPPGALHPGAMRRAGDEHRRAKRRREPAPRWALAFSGGADSLAMLLIFWAKFARPDAGAPLAAARAGRPRGTPLQQPADFTVLHFNHRLRGRAAEADEKFCREVCAALGVKFVAGRWRNAPKQASEAAARAARHDFFSREMTRRKIRLLWLAHQQDDIAETMLMRLARGSGTGGLAAPRPVQEMPAGRLHLRPMLTLKKSEIAAALSKAGAGWREDATNAGDTFFRNRVRRKVIPPWVEAAGRDAVAGAALSRELLEEDNAALEAWLGELKPLDRRGRLDWRKLAGKPRALVRRALHRWLLAARPETDLSRQGFNQLLAAVERGRDFRFSLGARGFAVARGGRLRFTKR